MPEGHISHRNAGIFAATIVGHGIARAEAPQARIASQRLSERLPGEIIAAAEAVGKHHLLRMESGRVLHSHLAMRGIWRVRGASQRHSRSGLFLAIHAGRHVALLYRCPMVRLFEPGEPLPPALTTTGPDLLDRAVDPAARTADALARVEGHRTVGEVLMDQRVVAGIGNVYKSETCFLCGVDPWRRVDSLSPEESADLGATAARLLADGVRDRGAIRTYRAPGAHPLSRERTWVYRRRGLPCRRCGTPVRSRGQGDANRTTYWCPACQT
ncbi:MAG: DNA-formamidopyrimidine glycosylase family protein [Miltoncostaeaceae bacterium]